MKGKKNESEIIEHEPVTIDHQSQTIHPLAIQQQQHHMELMKIAVQADGGIEKMEKLMDLQERWEQGVARKSFNAAMSKFQSMLPVIEKKGEVDYTSAKGRTHYSYAKLEDIAQAIQPALKETGLSYRFKQNQENGQITVKCIITHVDGHADTSELSSHPDTSGNKDHLKAIASAVQYLRRYTLTGILGIVVGGEDNEAAEVVESPHGEYYDDEAFSKNIPKWRGLIEGGKKSPGDIINMLNGKGHQLTDDQLNQISNGVA